MPVARTIHALGHEREVFLLKLNKHLSTLVFCALLAAMTMIFKRFAVFNIDWLRLSLENTPVLLSGILFGPLAGMVTGIVGDLIGCVFCGYAVNPIITLGMGLAGCVCGFMFRISKRLPLLGRLILSVYGGHILGNLVVKSIGLRLWLGTPWATLALRIPTYLIIGVAEIFVFGVLLNSKAFTKQMRKIDPNF